MRFSFFLVALLVNLNVYGQDHFLTNKVEGQSEFLISIESEALNEVREVTIHLPIEYHESKNKKFPVMFVLDGQDHYEHTLDIYSFLSKKKHVPNMIIVSIPHTDKRGKDYPTYQRGTDILNDGAHQFVAFIKEELMPRVEGEFRCLDYKIITGHSRAGLFVLHSFIHAPDLFNAYFAFSPSIHHTPRIVSLLEQQLKANDYNDKYFYGCVGGNEFYQIKDGFSAANVSFENHRDNKLRFNLEVHEVDGHQTTPFVGLYRGLKELFNPLKLTLEDYAKYNFNELVTYYSNISTEFGYEIVPQESELMSAARYYFLFETEAHDLEVAKSIYKITNHYYPESLAKTYFAFLIKWQSNGVNYKTGYESHEIIEERRLNAYGYFLLNREMLEEARYIFVLITKHYPNSANAFDSLGELQEGMGELAEALVHYKRALELSKKSDDVDSLAYYQESIDRVKKTLREED